MLLALGNLELELRLNLPQARHHVENALPTIRAFGTASHLAIALGLLGELARLEGDYELSMMFAAEALDIAIARLEEKANPLRRMEDAALLLGFMEEFRDREHVPRLMNLMPWYSRSIETLSSALSHERVLALRIEGAAMSYESARERAAKVGPST